MPFRNGRTGKAIGTARRTEGGGFSPRRIVGIGLIGCFLSIAAARAVEDDQRSTALTIYSKATPGAVPPELYRPVAGQSPPRGDLSGRIPGYAIVKQERGVSLKGGRSTIRFTDVAAYIDPTTVSFTSLTDPESTHVLEQSFEFDLVSTQKLLQRYIDREITVEQVRGERIEAVRGTLLSADNGLVLRTKDGGIRVLYRYANILFPELPGGLITRPTLVWDVTTNRPGLHRTRVTYETKGMTWWADYNVVFTPHEDANRGTLDIGAWVSILNQSGATYRDAKLKLIAGDVHRAPTPAKAIAGFRQARARAMVAEADAGFEEKAFFEYHLYTLGRPTTLPDHSTKQIELFPTARDVQCEKVLVYYGVPARFYYYGGPMTDRNLGIPTNKKVDIYLRFKNEKAIGMGMPLPSGRIRVFQKDTADDSLEFIGEDTIDHTPKDEEVLVKMGSAFDVVGERKQIDFAVDYDRHWMKETIEIKLRNHKDKPVRVLVKETLYRWVNWEIVEHTHDFKKIDARTIHFPVRVDKDGEVTIRYTVRYTW
ncbi:MAG: DUF4139 domain-containing protein [Planctomycetota bacterium]|nr:MAG: DUF4139 domain-containing protein [Planctomycetota bacterium]